MKISSSYGITLQLHTFRWTSQRERGWSATVWTSIGTGIIVVAFGRTDMEGNSRWPSVNCIETKKTSKTRQNKNCQTFTKMVERRVEVLFENAIWVHN